MKHRSKKIRPPRLAASLISSWRGGSLAGTFETCRVEKRNSVPRVELLMNVYRLEHWFQLNVALFRNEEQPMLIFTERIPPPRRPEIFDDGIKVDATSQKQEDDWVKGFIASLAGFFPKTGK
jgi:hypothetical protein